MQNETLALQRLAYEAAKEVASALAPGVTEKQAALRLREALEARGISRHFHYPFAWFGKRSAFHGMSGYRDFLPGDTPLGESGVGILDCAPIRAGTFADIGYSFTLEQNEEWEMARAFLLAMRSAIPGWITQYDSVTEFFKLISQQIERQGYTVKHTAYPFGVLGHRVNRLPFAALPRVRIPVSFLSWFSLEAQALFLKEGIYGALLRAKTKSLAPGLWAIEPHLGTKEWGIKFEEILVLKDGKARWLDEQPAW